jgi:hypothetical protein
MVISMGMSDTQRTLTAIVDYRTLTWNPQEKGSPFHNFYTDFRVKTLMTKRIGLNISLSFSMSYQFSF